MIETRPPLDDERLRSRMDPKLEPKPARALVPAAWLRPLANAPETARQIVDQVERIATEANRALESRTRIPPLWLSFIAFVIIPSFVASVYFAFFAADQFAVETRFAVRAIELEAIATPKGESAAFTFTPSGQNAYIVTSYIRSRAIVSDVLAKLDLRALYRRPEADFWARLRRNATMEQLTDYWQSMVETTVDANSSLVTVNVRAFRKEDAYALANAIVAASEALVNRISERARRDATAMAERDVRRAFEAVQATLSDLHKFRDEFGVIDPTLTGTEIGKLLAPLVAQKIKLESELFVAGHELSPDAPTVRVLREQLASAEKQIKELKSKLTSNDGARSSTSTVAGILAKFEELEVRKALAERFYALSKADLDRAQLRANRQSIYLTVFVPPAAPEISRYPHRLSYPLLIFLGFAIVWSIVVLLLATIEDHRL
ncbi:capsular polysaccharide transport system permease protein [Methylosinus sp. sav-2]|uniref:capsule biosynthesis protein n=1 Tax=Methylosinus sp. sav-2 TaxID=2485168 RepID=UPI00047EC86D|nr:capsule biosynthesis protein [Methylosinus sp. sav-2]TDX64876.1 capsular polysaccharide transport system permease protein [Methylosinus sp. sav-2]